MPASDPKCRSAYGRVKTVLTTVHDNTTANTAALMSNA
jgi:hypothetical protein